MTSTTQTIVLTTEKEATPHTLHNVAFQKLVAAEVERRNSKTTDGPNCSFTVGIAASPTFTTTNAQKTFELFPELTKLSGTVSLGAFLEAAPFPTDDPNDRRHKVPWTSLAGPLLGMIDDDTKAEFTALLVPRVKTEKGAAKIVKIPGKRGRKKGCSASPYCVFSSLISRFRKGTEDEEQFVALLLEPVYKPVSSGFVNYPLHKEKLASFLGSDAAPLSHLVAAVQDDGKRGQARVSAVIWGCLTQEAQQAYQID